MVDLDKLEALIQAATDGPWWAHDRGVGFEIALGEPATGRPDRRLPEGDRTDIGRREDAEFIAAARNELPGLIAELRQLRKQRDVVLRYTHMGELVKSEAIVAVFNLNQVD